MYVIRKVGDRETRRGGILEGFIVFLCGIPVYVAVDGNLPPNVIELRADNGEVVRVELPEIEE